MLLSMEVLTMNSSLKSLAALIALSLAVAPASAQPANSSDGVEQARMNYEGRILGNQVTLRSGPGENYYPVIRLDTGATVIINGIKFDWLRIVPPEGTHSLIAKEFVTVTGNSGRISGTVVNVRSGSTLNSQYSTIHGKLQRGDAVDILGEVELDGKTWLKIKPPPGTTLFVKKDFVEPVRALGPAVIPVTPLTTPPATPRDPVAGPAVTPPSDGAAGGGVVGNPADLNRDTGTGIPGTELANQPRTSTPATPREPSSIELARASAQQQAEVAYDQAETTWRAAMDKPLEDQPLPEILARFEALAVNEDLPVTLRQQSASTASFIRSRNQTREDVLKLRQSQAEMQARLQPLQAQNRQLADQFRQADMNRFTAIGQLQTSTLANLHRLVDPATGRTLVYLRSTGGATVGQFVGVKGPLSRDENLNIQLVTPESIFPIDPGSFGRGTTAEIFPPSLRGQLPTTQPAR